ncbi:unnamed protein product, partial [Staurois parvus]
MRGPGRADIVNGGSGRADIVNEGLEFSNTLRGDQRCYLQG